jgi:hypothetical protein
MKFHKMLPILTACAVLFGGSAFAQTNAGPASVPAMISPNATVRAQNRQTAHAVRKALVRTKGLSVSDIRVIAKGARYRFSERYPTTHRSRSREPLQLLCLMSDQCRIT